RFALNCGGHLHERCGRCGRCISGGCRCSSGDSLFLWTCKIFNEFSESNRDLGWSVPRPGMLIWLAFFITYHRVKWPSTQKT
ncbi:hypothetical protein L9F63_016782, partial [Diploptera punctata]